MNLLFILTILIVGFSGLVAQVLLLRELLVSFYGNELTLGIALANWVAIEAFGVFVIGKYIDRVRNKINLFIWLQIIFSLMLPISIYLSRTFKDILRIPFGEAMGLYTIFFVSLFIILPISFSHGALFSTGCKIYSLYIKAKAYSIGKVYTWETIGTMIGGISMTYLFIPYLNSFQIVFIVSLVNLAICFFLLKNISKTNYITLGVITLLIYLSLFGGLNHIQRLSIDKQWKGMRVLDYHNSIYGNVTVTKQLEQYTFFYNGVPIITTPYPDKQFIEDFGHLPLLFQGRAKDILIISGGAGGLINEILKHPIRKIDYVELDPLIIEMLKRYPTKLTQGELADNRVNIINTDARFFLKSHAKRYDIVLIGLSNQSDLSTNRFFTQEFFNLVKNRLNPDGVLAFYLPGSLTYLSQELKDLNVSILNGLKKVYEYVRIIPGDYNIFLASSSEGIMKVDSSLITKRKIEQNIKTNILIPDYLDYRLSKKWVDWFLQQSFGATKKTNQDTRPIAVFEMLKFSNKKFSPKLDFVLEYFKGLDLKTILILILLVTFLFSYVFYRNRKILQLTIVYSITTTGFFGMLTTFILLFSFQVFYGYLYHMIGMLISIFMAGTALGSILMTARIGKIKNEISQFRKLEILIIVFSLALSLFITSLTGARHYASVIFFALFFLSGLLLGLEFPLATKIYLGEKEDVGRVSGVLYGSDLIGAWSAGIFGGVILLPVLGLFNTCIVIVMLKLSSLFLLLTIKRNNSRDTHFAQAKGVPS